MMKFLKINNKGNFDLQSDENLFHSLGQFAQKRMGFKKPPVLNLVSDENNASKALGKTAYYDPESLSVTIYTDNRHTKDILRSLAHELIHHTQNENGMLNDSGYHGTGYAQKNKDLRQSEKEAYLKGNMCFRDWEDGLKQSKPTIYNEWRIKTMSTKKWKNNELMENLSNKFGFKMDLGLLKEEKEESKEEESEEKEELKEEEKPDEEGEESDKNKKEKKNESRMMKIIKNEIRNQLKEMSSKKKDLTDEEAEEFAGSQGFFDFMSDEDKEAAKDKIKDDATGKTKERERQEKNKAAAVKRRKARKDAKEKAAKAEAGQFKLFEKNS